MSQNNFNPLCEQSVGTAFDDQIASGQLIRFSEGGNGLHRREAWRCQGELGAYYVKLYEHSDPALEPEATFYEIYAPQLDNVANGRVVQNLDRIPFSTVIVSREVTGKPLDTLLSQASDQPDTRRTITAIGGTALKKLHAIKLNGFGLLTSNGPQFSTWKEYIDSIIAKRQEEQAGLLAAGFSTRMIGQTLDVLAASQSISVAPVLCHGDPKPSHVIARRGFGTLIDFGRAQGNLPIRDCLQYGGLEPTYFDEQTLSSVALEDNELPDICARAAALIRLTSIAVYAAKDNRLNHCAVLGKVIQEVLSNEGPPRTSVADFL